VKSAFQLAVNKLNVAPSEFWAMRPRHFWWLVEAAIPEREPGRLPRRDRDAMLAALHEAKKRSAQNGRR
jgi:hypothetical protein